MAKKGKENLVPNSARTAERVKEITSMGGKASGEARRRRKSMREWAKAFASMDTSTKGLDGEPIEADYAGAVVLAQFRKAIKEGDTASAKFVAELLGEMVQKIEHTGNGVVVQVTDRVLAQELLKAIDK